VELGHRAHTDLTAWLQGGAATTYRKPSPEALQRISPLIDEAEHLLDAKQTRQLRWLLGID
jgi:hypothetical protein